MALSQANSVFLLVEVLRVLFFRGDFTGVDFLTDFLFPALLREPVVFLDPLGFFVAITLPEQVLKVP
jgi:hypothetical protein